MASSNRKKILEAGLKALLATFETQWLIKGLSTFVVEYSSKIDDLPDEQRTVLASATTEECQEVLRELSRCDEHSQEAARESRQTREIAQVLLKKVEYLEELLKTYWAKQSGGDSLVAPPEAPRPLINPSEGNPDDASAVALLSYIWQYPKGDGVRRSWAVKESSVLRGDLEEARRYPGAGIAVFSTHLAGVFPEGTVQNHIAKCVHFWAVEEAQPNDPYLVMTRNPDSITGHVTRVPDFRHTIAVAIILARTGLRPDQMRHYRHLVLEKQREDGGWPAGEGATVTELFSAIYAVEFLHLCAQARNLDDTERKVIERALDDGVAWLIRDTKGTQFWECGVFENEPWDWIIATAWVIRRLAPYADHGHAKWIECLSDALGELVHVANSKRHTLGNDSTQHFRVEARIAAATSVALRTLPLDAVKRANTAEYLGDWRDRAYKVLGDSDSGPLDLATALFLVDSLVESDKLRSYARRALDEFGK